MKYTKEQLLGVRFKQYSTEYIILDGSPKNDFKFEKPDNPGYYYEDWSVSRVNDMINGSLITLLTQPNVGSYEIY